MKCALLFEVMFVIGNKCVVTFTCRMRWMGGWLALSTIAMRKRVVAAESKEDKKQCEVISTISRDKSTNLHTPLLILSMVYVCTCLYFFLARHWSIACCRPSSRSNMWFTFLGTIMAIGELQRKYYITNQSIWTNVWMTVASEELSAFSAPLSAGNQAKIQV